MSVGDRLSSGGFGTSVAVSASSGDAISPSGVVALLAGGRSVQASPTRVGAYLVSF